MRLRRLVLLIKDKLWVRLEISASFLLMAEPGKDFYSNHWLTTVLIDSNEFSISEIQNALLDDEIDCRPLWKPMHLQPVFNNTRYYGNGISERLFEMGLCLPSGSNLTD